MALATGKLAAKQKAIRTSDLKRLEKTFRKLATKYGADLTPSVIVGYTANYAIFVHEIKMKHNVGEWKFLERPARQNKALYGKVIAAALKLGESANAALLIGGLRLQRDSQNLVPVDTGNLKASAFTRTIGTGQASLVSENT